MTFTVLGAGRLWARGTVTLQTRNPTKALRGRLLAVIAWAWCKRGKRTGRHTRWRWVRRAFLQQRRQWDATVVELRPQVPVWERAVPEGSGITHLWRPKPVPSLPGMMAFLLGGGATVFTLIQTGSVLTGQVEGGGGSYSGGGEAAVFPITDGKVNRDSVSFKSGNGASVRGDSKGRPYRVDENGRSRLADAAYSGASGGADGEKPAVGPAPDGSDPSFDLPAKNGSPTVPLVLHRAQR